MNNITLNINYLNTTYIDINQKIDLIIKKYIKEFYKHLNKNIDNVLNITCENHIIYNYLSISINITMEYKRLNKYYFVETIIYDINKQKFIQIDDLLKKNKYLLNKLSTISKKFLYQKNIYDKETIYNKTGPNKNNFNKFLLTKKGLKLYFTNDKITEIIIPYKFIKNKKV